MTDVASSSTSGGAGEQLAAALSDAGAVLSLAVSRAPDLFGEGRARPIREAWGGAQADLNELIRIVRPMSDEQLERVGLSGVQADGKLAGLTRAGHLVRAALGLGRPRVARKLFVRFSGWLNSLLGSLLKEVPLVGEIFKEFKEHLENAASDRIVEEEERESLDGLDEWNDPLGDDGF